MKVVYVPMSADIIHPGHIDVIEHAKQHGNVVVGLLSDEAIKQKKGQKPVMTYAERFAVVKNIKGVSEVIEQLTPDYKPNLINLRPDFVVHGDDWPEIARRSVVDTIAEWGGVLIETDYSTSPTSSTLIKQRVLKQFQ